MMHLLHPNILNLSAAIAQPIGLPLLADKGISADILRIDRIHPVVSGNKWFKLKHYLQQAIVNHQHSLLSFGGAYSNHIVATAFAAREFGLKSIGIIRGEKPSRLSHTLQNASQYGMQLEFVSRAEYQHKTDADWLKGLSDKYPGAYMVPEGGAGEAGVKGAAEILALSDSTVYTHFLCAMGTGTVLKGLAQSAANSQQIIGIPVLKGFEHWLQDQDGLKGKPNVQVFTSYHFGGYAKNNKDLFAFMNQLYRQTGIPTDFVYTAKLLFATVDLIQKDYFPANSRLLLIHGGGLQGNESLPEKTLIF
jgi:1-aminocyclopropane-1-carboxylate deaminase/D-cysteine desulfhydrase-like pyridoxal-dependent ACC family enzyme